MKYRVVKIGSVPTSSALHPYINGLLQIALSERFSHPLRRVARPTGQVFALSQSDPMENKLLSGLPREHFNMLAPYIVTVSYSQNTILMESGDEVDQVYFPHSGMLSLLAVMRDGKAIETATVGREGVVGAMAGLGLYRSMVRVVVQLPMSATKIASAPFRKAVAASDPLRNMCIQYNEVLLTQARITAACNALHPVEERFARWLLQSADRADSNTVGLTQELMAEMLGVRRTSVTEVAGKLQAAGMISYSRGVIKIIDRAALARVSCECYQTLQDQAAKLT
jgi:CRP-like cAMP-binding protein